jgi:hypothetical protein
VGDRRGDPPLRHFVPIETGHWLYRTRGGKPRQNAENECLCITRREIGLGPLQRSSFLSEVWALATPCLDTIA